MSYGGVPPTVRLASDIADQFPRLSPEEAAQTIADHITRFWDPRMRRQLIDAVAAAGVDCNPYVAAAAARLTRPSN